MKQNNVMNDLLLLLHAQFKTFSFAENVLSFWANGNDLLYQRKKRKEDTFHPKIYGSLIIIVIQQKKKSKIKTKNMSKSKTLKEIFIIFLSYNVLKSNVVRNMWQDQSCIGDERPTLSSLKR